MKRSRDGRVTRPLDPHPPSLARALLVAGGAALACLAFTFVVLSMLAPAPDVPERTGVPAGPVRDTRSNPVADTPEADPLAPLLRAIEAHDPDRAAGVAASLPPGVIDATPGGKTPLMHAASLGSADLIRALLAHGADPNARGASERTALQYAVERDHIEAARALLDAGADIDGHDTTLLTPLIMAADRGHTELALLLIERGADVNHVHTQGWTALIDAARTGNAVLVERLLENGARRDARMPKGQTARDFAAQAGHAEIVRMLDRPRPNRAGQPGPASALR